MELYETLMKYRQLILLFLGLVPGILAVAKVISGAQATLVLVVLFVISRRFAKAAQKQFEEQEAERLAREQRLAIQSKKKGKGKAKGQGKDD
ncbi:unnamed protein product [Calypogeia fissa]